MLLVCLLWRDSAGHYSQWMNKSFKVTVMDSSVDFMPGDYTGYPYQKMGFTRGLWSSALPEEATLFPSPAISPERVGIPLWFILCSLPALLGLVWIGSMKTAAEAGRK